jgi:hypothetical protein
VFLSIKSLYYKESLLPSFDLTNFSKLSIYTFFFFSIGYPIEKTFGNIQSLNFFQSLFLLLSFSYSAFIAYEIASLFKINFDIIDKLFLKSLMAFGAIIIINTSVLHVLIIITLIGLCYLRTKKKWFVLSIAQFFLVGLIFLPDFKSIQVMLSGFISWSSIFLYYNEFYILNSIGADASFYIPLLILFMGWNKYQNKSIFLLTEDNNDIKLPQFVFTCLILLFIF